MAEFDIQLPDGRVATIQAADQATAIRGAQEWHAANPIQMSGADRLADVGKSAVTGAANLASGLAGMPGDIQSLTRSGAEWLAGKPLPPSPVGQLPGSGDIRGQIEQWTGPLHKPQTPEGKMASASVEFLPGALMPGGPGRRLLNVLAPAAGSELGGAAAKGMDLPEGWGKLIGGVAGGLTPSALGRMVTPFPANAERTAAVNTLRNEGVTSVSAGQATGNKGLQAFESERGGGRGADLLTQQGEQFTSAALRRIGENAPRATPEVLERAYNRIGQQFDNVSARNTLAVDRRFANDFAQVQQDYNFLANPMQRQVVGEAINDIIGVIQQNNGVIPGAQYQAMRSRLGAAARGTDDNQLRTAMYGLQHALDDVMERSIRATGNAADVNAWREARNQYRNFLVVERAATSAGENAALGIISPAALAQATKTVQGRRNYATGQGDFDELARSGVAVMSPLPNSGTPIRTSAQNFGMSPAGAATGAAIGQWLGGPVGAGIGAVGGGYLPSAAGRLALTRPGQWWLSNQGLANALNNGPSQIQQAILNAVLARPQSQSLIAAPQSR